LVFIEGMTGAGKSTTARNVAAWLEARGEPVHLYHEMDPDNPIRTKGVDAMRSNHPQVGRLPDVGPDGFALDPSVYGPTQWSDLARRSIEGPETLVLESRYMQNSVQPRYMAGAPAEKVYDGFAKIAERIAPASALLVYLRQSDVAAMTARTLVERGAPWAPWLVETFSAHAWAKQRGVTGEEAIAGFYEDWEKVAARLCEIHRGPSVVLTDAHADWDGSLREIHAALRRET
jgi:hypothetical protein